jgi:hypothetical protein
MPKVDIPRKLRARSNTSEPTCNDTQAPRRRSKRAISVSATQGDLHIHLDSRSATMSPSEEINSGTTMTPAPSPASPVFSISRESIDLSHGGDPRSKIIHDTGLWEFDRIMKVNKNSCQILWSDSELSGADLFHGILHGRKLLEFVSRCHVQRNGLFLVAWHPTWEPVKDWSKQLEDMSLDSRFMQQQVVGKVNGLAAQCYRPCIVHKSLLKTTFLDAKPILEAVASKRPVLDDEKFGRNNGLLYITWKQRWVDAKKVNQTVE